MIVTCPCRICGRQLDPAQELRFHFETETQTSPRYLELIRELPHVSGMPLRVCRPCQHRLESQPRLARQAAPATRTDFRSAVLTAFGVVAFGWVFKALVGVSRVA